MAFQTFHVFHSPAATRGVEISDIVLVQGTRRGWVSEIGRKYVTVKIYGAKAVKIDPLSTEHVWTGEQHQ